MLCNRASCKPLKSQFVISGLQVQLLSPAPQMNAQTMDLNRLCVFFLQKKRLKLPVRLQQAGKFASGFQWMFPGISADKEQKRCKK